MAKIRIVLTGGGSGGHIYPLLAVAEALRAEAQKRGAGELDLRYMGAAGDYKGTLEEAGIPVYRTAGGKWRRYTSGILANLLDIPRFFWGLLQAWAKLYRLMPDAVFSKGGTGALPVVLMCWFYRIPVVIHESDASPGLTNLLSGRFAKRVVLSFEDAARYFNPQKTMVSGTPVRAELLQNKRPTEMAKQELGFDAARPLLLVLGGSQGAQRLNEFILLNLKSILPLAQILHQTGEGNFMEVKKISQAALLDVPPEIAKQSRYLPEAYLTEKMPIALSAADVILSRAGSGTIFEIAAFGKASILVPLPEAARDHQRNNAYAYAKTGAAAVLEESNLLPAIFLRELQNVLSGPNVKDGREKAAAAFFKPNAAADIARAIWESLLSK